MSLFYAKSLFSLVAMLLFLAASGYVWHKQSGALRPFVVFTGVFVLSSAFVDIFRHLIANNIQNSDAQVFSQKCLFLPGFVIGTLWLLVSSVLAVLIVSFAILFFRQPGHALPR